MQNNLKLSERMNKASQKPRTQPKVYLNSSRKQEKINIANKMINSFIILHFHVTLLFLLTNGNLGIPDI